MKAFAGAYRTPTESDLLTALDQIARECHRYVNPELAALIDGSRPRLDEIAAAEVKAASGCRNAAGTLNLPCLITFMMMVEQLARSRGLDVRKIVHDEQRIYGEGFREAFDLHRNGPDEWITHPDRSIGYGAIRRINDFEIQRSIDQPIVQAADLLAGAINDIYIGLYRGRMIEGLDLDIAKRSLLGLFVGDDPLAWAVCSEPTMQKVRIMFEQFFPIKADEEEEDLGKLLPFLRDEVSAASGNRISLDLPIYGITSVKGDRLLFLNSPDCDQTNMRRYDRVVPLFTNRDHVERFQSAFESDWTEPQQIREFNVPDLSYLTRELDKLVAHVHAIAFIDMEHDARPVRIEQFLAQLKNIVRRICDAAQTGILGTLVQRHTLPNGEAMSILLSTGCYGAMMLPSGDVVTAASRELAVQKLSEQSAASEESNSGDANTDS